MKFFSDYCVPCKTISPIIKELSEKYGLKLIEVNVSDSPKLIKQYGIMAVPTILFLKDDIVLKQVVGSVNKPALENIIKKLK